MKIGKSLYEKIVAYMSSELPNESCGIAAGKDDIISHFFAMSNSDQSSEHFSMVPKEQFYVAKRIRELGLKTIAVVHSHPYTPARPSKEDIRLALDRSVLYAIVSFAHSNGGNSADMKLFRIAEDKVTRESLDIFDDKPYGSVILPKTVIDDVGEFKSKVDQYKKGKLREAAFKAYRVPMGMYQQRNSKYYMIRIRIAGIPSPIQLQKIAFLSKRFGDGIIHLTTRSDIQIHGVTIDGAAEIMNGLLEVGLSSRGGGGNTVRNIHASPLSGIDPEGVFDVIPYQVQATEFMLESRSSWHLPRKFKIVFSDSDSDNAGAWFADLGFIATHFAGKDGFRVVGGGGLGASSAVAVPLIPFIEKQDAIAACEAGKRLFDRVGNRSDHFRARLRYAVSRLGKELFRKNFIEEFEKVKAESIEYPEARFNDFEKVNLFFDKKQQYKRFSTKEPGYVAVGFHPELGLIDANKLLQIADFCEKNNAEFRPTQTQGFYIARIRAEETEEAVETFKEFYNPVASTVPVCCASAATCKLGICLSRELAGQIRSVMLEHRNNEKFPQIHISGCSNNCGQHSIAKLGFSGMAKRVNGKLVPYYEVLIRQSENSLAKSVGILPARNVPLLLRQADSPEEIPDLLDKFQRVPDYRDDPSFYRDWGSDEDFSLAGRGPGECGAGVLELIEFDLKEASSYLQAGKFYESILAAARALLVIKGIDTTVDTEIFEGFKRHFIDTGYIEKDATDIINAATRSRLSGEDLLPFGQKIAALISRIKLLRESLDKNLNFKIPPLTGKSDTGVKEESCKRLDLSSVKCPINFVMAKVELEKIPIGQTLEVVLDDGDPIRNVPESFANQGQEIVKIEHLSGKSNLMIVKRIK